jgi:hypothetical protein
MLKGFDKLLEFSSFYFHIYGAQSRPPVLKGLKYYTVQTSSSFGAEFVDTIKRAVCGHPIKNASALSHFH